MTQWLDTPPAIVKRGRPRSTLRTELRANPGKWREVKLYEGRHMVAEGFERTQRTDHDGTIRAFMRWPQSADVINATAHVVAQANDF